MVSPVKRPRDRPHTDGISARISVTPSWPMSILHRPLYIGLEISSLLSLIHNSHFSLGRCLRPCKARCHPARKTQNQEVAPFQRVSRTRLRTLRPRLPGFAVSSPFRHPSPPPGQRSAVPCSRTLAWADGSRPASAGSPNRAQPSNPKRRNWWQSPLCGAFQRGKRLSGNNQSNRRLAQLFRDRA